MKMKGFIVSDDKYSFFRVGVGVVFADWKGEEWAW